MPPKSRARTGGGEPVEPPRKSSRISRKTEERLAQVTSTAQKGPSSERVQKETGVPSVAKPHQRTTRQRKNDSSAVLGRPTAQAPNTKSTKKAKKAAPIAVSVPGALIRPLKSVGTQTRTNDFSQYHLSDRLSAEPSERLDVDSETVEFYHSLGYEVPREVSMASTVKSSKASSRKPKKPKDYAVNYDSAAFTTTLQEHKISYFASKDPNIAHYKSIIFTGNLDPSNSRNSLEREIQRREDALWDLDMAKCLRSNEARFQRTIMMAIVNRQELDEKLEFICEALWISERFPCKDCTPKLCKLPQAKPDTAVSFKAETLLPSDGFHADWERLKEFKSHIFPEGCQEYQDERAFHFFLMEAKGKRGSLDNQKAQFQNLNTASQALYNIYYCMKRTEDLETFFKEVRVFSAVATTEGLSIRVHWPVKLHHEQCFNKEYPIGFQFDELGRLRGDYSRAQANSIVYNILHTYGVLKLHPILKKTIAQLLKLYPCKAPAPLLAELEQAARTEAESGEAGPLPASQSSSGQKRRASALGHSFTSNSRRRLDNVNINDSQGSEASVEE